MDLQAEQDDGAPSQEKVDQFIETTQESEATARETLNSHAWNMNLALDAYYGGQQPSSARNDTAIGGNESSAGRPAPYAEGSSSRSQPRKQAQGKTSNLKTFGDLHKEEDNVGEHADDESRGDLFAGGEKSGLAVQDRDALGNAARRLMENARRAAAQPERSAAAGPSQSSYFSGSGQTLGGEGVPSCPVPSLRSNPIQRVGQYQPDQPPIRSTIHVWENGFSLNDGPLYRSDSENGEHRLIFQFLKTSAEQQSSQESDGDNVIHAPDALLNRLREILQLKHHDMAEARIDAHLNEKWRLVHPFAAAGRRLGSPVPGDGSSSIESTIASQTSTRSTTTTATGSASMPTGVDESQPIVTIRIQLPNGTRVPTRFNTIQTIGDVYGFVQQTSPETRSRNWVLATTFPNKEHIDHDAVLGEMDEFKRGGTAVVKWA
ncbi:hypothetical protein RB595_007553 [Gaeumannomyces hyphopodioides]